MPTVGVAKVFGNRSENVANNLSGAVHYYDIPAQALLDADVLTGRVADDVVAVE